MQCRVRHGMLGMSNPTTQIPEAMDLLEVIGKHEGVF